MSLIAPAPVLRYEVPQIAHPSSIADRWANYVLGACRSEIDPRTLGIWSHQVAISYSSLCESCRLIGVRPIRARDFTRILRIMTKTFEPFQLASLLDISDRRTLDTMLQNAGFTREMRLGNITVLQFLENQQFIDQQNAGLAVIKSLFKDSN